MPRIAVLTEDEKKERKRALYNMRKSDTTKAEHDVEKRKEYLQTIQQVKLSLPIEKADQLKAACQKLGDDFKKPQDLINRLIDKYLAGEIEL